MSKMRVNGHRSRKGTNGKPTTARHNDRDFDVSKAEHIQQDLIAKNEVYKYADIDGKEQLTLDQYEQKFYEQNFSEQLENRNQKQIEERHKNRVQTMEQLRRNMKFCPEESIFTIGNRDNPISPKILKNVFADFVEWHDDTFKNAKIIDAALHLDEPDAAPHIHARQVWFADCRADGKWHKEIGQALALSEMGIERPELSKKESRYNNAKVTYTALCREKWLDICEAHGVDVEREAQDKSKSGLPLMQLKYNTLLKKIGEKESEIIALDLQVEDSTTNLDSVHFAIQKAEAEKAELERQIAVIEQDKTNKRQELTALQDKSLAYQQPPKKALESKQSYEDRVATGQQAVAVLQKEQENAEKEKIIAEKAKSLQKKQLEISKLAQQVEQNNAVVTADKEQLDRAREDFQRKAPKRIAAEARRQAQEILDSNGIQLPDTLLDEQMRAVQEQIQQRREGYDSISKNNVTHER